MLNKNNVLIGAIAALLFPAVGCVVAYFLKNNLYVINKPALPYLIAVGLNLVLIRISLKRDQDQTAKGIMLTTFLFFLLVFIFVIHIR